jgi:hypothetical protein
MKRFYASCGALVVSILLVGSVHAGPRHSSHRPGHRARHHSGHHRRALPPWRPQLPSQWLPQQTQDTGSYNPDTGGYDPNAGDYQPGGDISGGNVAQPAVAPKGGSQRRLHKFGSRSPRISGSVSRHR